MLSVSLRSHVGGKAETDWPSRAVCGAPERNNWQAATDGARRGRYAGQRLASAARTSSTRVRLVISKIS